MTERGAETGLVMDILRCSLQDGPGVRTTVFLKGCAMHCAWCHNPEGIDRRVQLRFDEARCTSCGRCAAACPGGVHTLTAAGHLLDRTRCAVCGRCVQACLTGALSLCGREMRAEDVWAVARKDLAYYQRTGGGLTLSGGEPLLQAAFAARLLALAKHEGVHTAVETAGNVPWSAIAAVEPVTDLFLFDYKLSDPTELSRLTGGQFALIAGNLAQLAETLENGENTSETRREIWLRCPIIPGLNDTEAHFASIRALRQKYPCITRVEVMPYHAFGLSKWAQVGQEAPWQGDVPDRAQIARWRACVGAEETAGC